MAQENVVVVRFTEPSKAYQALSVLKECDAEGRIGLESAAVVDARQRGAAHSRRAPTTSASSDASGSLIGMLVGVLGARSVSFSAGAAGALMGGAFDVDRA
jgi:Predicted membrane protein